MYRRFTWRILSNYVTPWEFERLRGQITDYEQWCARWSAHAARHVTRGDEALAAGHTVTAGDAYLRGALAYHWASFVFTHDQAQFRAALEAMAATWAKAAPLLSPPMEILAVPFAGLTLPGYLRLPVRPAAGRGAASGGRLGEGGAFQPGRSHRHPGAGRPAPRMERRLPQRRCTSARPCCTASIGRPAVRR